MYWLVGMVGYGKYVYMYVYAYICIYNTYNRNTFELLSCYVAKSNGYPWIPCRKVQ